MCHESILIYLTQKDVQNDNLETNSRESKKIERIST